jgi:hypothetical protein
LHFEQLENAMAININLLKVAIVTFLTMFSASFCCAEEHDRRHMESPEIISVSKQTEEKIISDYAEQHRWCDRSEPRVKDGQIGLYWIRDKDGKCLKQGFIVNQ